MCIVALTMSSSQRNGPSAFNRPVEVNDVMISNALEAPGPVPGLNVSSFEVPACFGGRTMNYDVSYNSHDIFYFASVLIL